MEETKLTIQAVGDTKSFHAQESVFGNTVDGVNNKDETNDNRQKMGRG